VDEPPIGRIEITPTPHYEPNIDRFDRDGERRDLACGNTCPINSLRSLWKISVKKNSYVHQWFTPKSGRFVR
jgi:hypothetical protein